MNNFVSYGLPLMTMGAVLTTIVAGRWAIHRKREWYGASLGGKNVNVTFYEFFWCPFFALGPRFHENCDILEVVHYNIKLLY